VRKVPLLLPPLPEQRAIANILSSLDAKIELLREQNETLEKTAQTIFQEWFGRYSVESPEKLPEGWRVGKLSEITEITS
jgi:type I restriction enzyme S subunit